MTCQLYIVYNNIFMALFEEKFVHALAHQLLPWIQFIDDNLFMRQDGYEELEWFNAHLNACHITIRFA